MIKFLLGFILGEVVGVMLMCLVQINRYNDRINEDTDEED